MSRKAPLFDDRFADTRMRRTIPRYARLGGLVVVVTAPLLAPSTERLLMLLGLAGLAFATAAVLRMRNLIDRLPPKVLHGSLLMYVVLIALAAAAHGTATSPYLLFTYLPVTFTAVFFTGLYRFSTAVLAGMIGFAVLQPLYGVSVSHCVVRTLILVLVAGFGAEVSDLLRDSLANTSAMHRVLEAASGDPLGAEIAEIGLDAALSVVDWDAAAVLELDGNVLRITAARGTSPEVLANYATHPVPVDDEHLAALVARSAQIVYLADVPAELGPHHVLAVDGFRSLAVAPVISHGITIAVLVVATRRPRPFEDRDRDRLVRVADQLGLALGNARAYRREAEAAEQLRELNTRKDEFLANISHELRTPAAVIRMVTATLERDRQRLLPLQIEDMHHTLERHASHLCTLIDNLLDEAAGSSGEARLAVTSLEWREALMRWATEAERQTGRPITVEVPPEPVMGLGDAVKLERIVSNLLTNAAKFSPSGSPIVASLTTDRDAGWVAIEVTDRGVGIPEDQIPHIFDRFFQVDGGATRAVGGFGIGLSLVRHFVEAHGGQVTVRSQPGEGSTFRVQLPLFAPMPTPTPRGLSNLSG